jgi:hypothetical protein
LQPLAFRFCFLWQILPAVLLFPPKRDFPGRSVLQAPVRISRKIWHQFQPRCPSESSVLLLGPGRRRLGSSSYGIGGSFRVYHPLKYHRHCFDDPALPLALASAVRFSFNGLPTTTV